MLRITKYLLFAVALTPLITLNLPFGTIVWKLFYMRIVIELAVLFFCIHILRGGKIEFPWRHPIVILLGAYTLSLIVSAVGAFSPYRAVWGNLERGEGLITWFHYLVFFLLMLLVWKKEDWLKMFRLSFVAGLVLMGYGALQYFEVTYFPPFRIAPSERAISLVGNAAFFATHLVFLLILASLVRLRAKKTGSKIWEYIAVGSMVSAIAVIFMTGTRGAMLGIGIGGVVALGYVFGVNIRKKEKNEKRKALAAGAILFLLGAGTLLFVATKEAPAWKIIPNVERVSSILSRGIKGTSAETRLIIWKMSYEAWKERPILGWGQENNLPAFTKHFNPRLDKGGETWFDRSHNNLIDIAVTQGLLGLIIYLSLMGAIVWFAIGRRKNELLEKGKPYILWGLVAYIIQNLFLFDQPLSYLYLIIFAGFLIASREAEVLRDRNSLMSYDLVKRGLAAGASVLAVYAIYAWNITPFLQIQRVEAAKKTPNQEEVLRLLEKGFRPYNFAQHDLRAHMVDHEYSFQPEIFTNPGFEELTSFLLESIQEARKKDPADSRMLIREIQVLTLQSQAKQELLSEVEKVASEGIRIAPTKPVFYRKLALAFANEGKYEKARDAAQKGIDLYSEAPQSNFQLGLVLAMGGASYHEEAVRAFKKLEELDPTLGFLKEDINNYLLVYAIWKDNTKIADIVWRVVSGGGGHEIQLSYFKTALGYFIQKEKKDEVMGIARKMSGMFPQHAEDLGVYIDLAEKGKWNILKKL